MKYTTFWRIWTGLGVFVIFVNLGWGIYMSIEEYWLLCVLNFGVGVPVGAEIFAKSLKMFRQCEEIEMMMETLEWWHGQQTDGFWKDELWKDWSEP